MKMLKKAAAVVLAAAMSLVMLTGCGGGSSGTQYKLAKVLGASEKTGKMFMDVTVENVNGYSVDAKTATDSKSGKTIMAIGEKGEIYDMYMSTKDCAVYEIDSNDDSESEEIDVSKLYWKKVSANATFAAASSAVPSSEIISKLKVNPEYKYGNETYYAEILSDQSMEIAYCFSGDTLVYVVVKANGMTIGEKVNSISATFPEKVNNDIPVSYDTLMNLKTVG